MRMLIKFLMITGVLITSLSIKSELSYAQTKSGIFIIIDGKTIESNPLPIIKNDRILVPSKILSEYLDADIKWDKENKTITIITKGNEIILNMGSRVAVINGKHVQLDVEPLIVNDISMIPIRFISEVLGDKIQWVEQIQTMIITSPSENKLSVQQISKDKDKLVLIQSYDSDGNKNLGSGFIISPDGDIVTNYHVVKKSSNITISLDNNTSYNASILKTDPKNDLAILKISAQNLPTVTIGNSSKIGLGDSIVTIGSPYGLQNTVTTGIISSTSRIIDGREYIQISAPIDFGSSGGALFNMNGEVIGVTSDGLSYSNANINFAIPSNTLIKFLKNE